MPIDFDAIDDLINAGSGASIDDLGPLTWMAWIYPRTKGDSDFPRIISKGDGGAGNIARHDFFIEDGAGDTRSLVFFIDGATDLSAHTEDNVITYNQWQFVAVTWDGSTTAVNIHIYVNGLEVASYQLQQNGASLSSDASYDLLLGNWVNGTRSFDGLISEKAVWNVELNADEIAQLYNPKIKGMPLQVQPANLVVYWPMDDGPDGSSADGDTVRDLSGNGNNGTGDDGANNTGLAWKAEEVLSYPPSILPVIFVPLVGNVGALLNAGLLYGKLQRSLIT